MDNSKYVFEMKENVPVRTSDAKSLHEMNANELRDLAVSLGADKNKLYGTSKQALIVIIDKLKREKSNDMKTVDADYLPAHVYEVFFYRDKKDYKAGATSETVFIKNKSESEAKNACFKKHGRNIEIISVKYVGEGSTKAYDSVGNMKTVDEVVTVNESDFVSSHMKNPKGYGHMKYDPILCMMVEDKRTTDAVNGSVEKFYEMMKGKSKSEVEKIVMNAKGNPNAEAAYIKWKHSQNDKRTVDESKAYSVGYKSNGVYQSIAVIANSEAEAVRKAKEHFAKRGKEAEVFGASIGESIETIKRKGKPIIDSQSVFDKAIRSCDSVKVVYSDALGDNHTFIKESVEEAKKWIDSGKFPHGAAFNVKIDGVLYKKEAR